jgi:gliding motility-associated-like protein
MQLYTFWYPPIALFIIKPLYLCLIEGKIIMGRYLYLFMLVLGGTINQSKAQCITSFPYFEDFNGTTTQWFSGGVNNDWQRTVASKTYIFSSTKCWVTAGNSLFYLTNQRSWVQSPCFDFTNVQFPYISFQYIFECQNTMDGALIQYSTDSGVTWTNVGAHGDPEDCINENWYNNSTVNNLNTLALIKQGWSGSSRPATGTCVVGNGTLTWQAAKKALPFLAGESDVIFRFCFGTGPSCNSFDGFAFDDFYVGEAPALTASYVKGCTQNQPLSYNFFDNSGGCPASYSWNFGDPASGSNNTSSAPNPTHQYPAQGTYTVSLTVSSTQNAPSTISLVLNTIQTNANITPPKCTNDTNGNLQVVTQYASSPMLHKLSNGKSTNLPPYNLSNLEAGTYTVTTEDAAGCLVTKSFTITDPQPIAITNVVNTKPSCVTNTGGVINIFGSGGTGAYSYSSSTSGSFTASSALSPLSSGIYTIVLKDANNCSTSSLVNLEAEGLPVINDVNILGVRCHNGSDGKIQVLASSPVTTIDAFGITPVAEQIDQGTFAGMAAGTYTILVKDASGCTTTSLVTLFNPEPIKFENTKNKYLLCKPTQDSIWVYTQGGTEPLSYILQPNFLKSEDGLFKDIPMGNYLVQAVDANECKVELPLKVDEGDCCSNIYIPNAFTPNDDRLNDYFKMNIFGTVIINKFQIVNNFGQIVFNNEVTQGWDGYHNGAEAPPGTYYYIIQYTCKDGKSFSRLGDINLLR